MNQQGISLEVVYEDGELIELMLTVDNGRFRGAILAYVARDTLKDAAETLYAFPASPRDERALEFGEFGQRSAGGVGRFRFFCIDAAGHAAVEARFEGGERVAGVTETATLVLLIELAAIDTFINDLLLMHREKRGTAWLPQTV